MLKLLLNHWHSHREPLPFVLTDDPLYCSHLTKSPFPEVYSVNRINPIFEEDEEKASNVSTPPPSLRRVPGDGHAENEQFKTYPVDRKTVKSKNGKDPFTSNFLLRKPISKPILNESAYSLNSHFKYYSPDSIFDTNSTRPLFLKRSSSEERREEETKSSDDTGYSSSGKFKSSATLESDGSVEIHPMSSDSDDCSRPEAVTVSADVHRVSTPDDVLVRSPSSESSANYSYRSYGSSPEPFDSLTMSSVTDTSVKDVEIRRPPNSAVREKLQKLLEKGNPTSEDKRTIVQKDEMEIQKTKHDLMKSLTRALNNKVPKRDDDEEVVTRVEDTNTNSVTIDRKSTSSSTSPKRLLTNSDSSGITRQDESNSSSLSSFNKPKKHLLRNSKHSSENKVKNKEDSSDSQKTHKCKICENAQRPLAFHQLLPGHWSYDNIYLPQIHNMICPCMHPHHGVSVPPSSDEDSFYPMFYHQNLSRLRHSWAPYTNGLSHNTENKGVSTSSKNNTNSRYSPDGETDSSNTSSSLLKKSLPERRSLKERAKCKCEHCADAIVDKCPNAHHNCPCYCLAHRRVKFASDSDLSQHRHFQSFRMKSALANSDPINPALVMSLPHLNGHVANKGNTKDNGKSMKPPPLIPRGLKEPIKMDELYRSYPINFRDWEAHYRRNFHQKRKKRALTMVAMAIGIILAVGIAVGLTFVFLRIRRPVS